MKPGEKVICIKDNPDGNCPIRMGSISEVVAIERCKCGALLLDLGLSVNNGIAGTMCPVCDQTVYTAKWLQDAKRFRPVHYDDHNHGELKSFTIEVIEIKTKKPIDYGSATNIER